MTFQFGAAISALATIQPVAIDDDAMAVDGGEGGASTETSAAALRERAALLGPEAWGGAAPAAGRFEWVDGVLLRAAVRGEWVGAVAYHILG